MNEWKDVTLTLSENLPAWPGERPFGREFVKRIGEGDALYNLSRIAMSSHFGTHMDAPLHFINGGASIDQVDPALLMGPAYVLDLSPKTSHIGAADLKGKVPPGVTRLLVKTRNSAYLGDGVFHEDFVAFTVPAARFLSAAGVRLLGLDYYSIAPFDAPAGAHRAFLGAPGSAALENVDLKGVEEGWYDLVCLPLKIEGGEGSPARALIRKREGPGT
jgi:arylformamidase